MTRRILAVALLLLCAAAAYAQFPMQDLYVSRTVNVGARTNPKITMNGVTGNGTFAGTLTVTGGVVGGISPGTFGNGTAGGPSITFTSDGDTGFYRIGANNIGMTIGGTKRWDFSTTTSALTGILTVSGASTLTGDVAAGGTLTVTGISKFADGTAAAPSLTFATDTDTGVYQVRANTLGVAVQGEKILEVHLSGLRVLGTVLSSNGAVDAPAYSYTSDTDSGSYIIGANNIGIAVNGAKVLDIATTGLAVTGDMASDTLAIGGGYGATGVTITAAGVVSINGATVIDGALTQTGAAAFGSTVGVTGISSFAVGAVALPGIVLATDVDSGIYQIAANNIGVSCAAAKVLDIGITGLGVVGVVKSGNGAAATPAYSFTADPDTGVYRAAANDVGIAANGVVTVNVTAAGMVMGAGLIFSNDPGLVTAPSYTFTGDLDSGMYRIAANNLGVAVLGAKVLDVSATGLGVVGIVLNGNGAVGAPAFSFTADPDSGVYRVAANSVGIAVNGVLAASFTVAGEVIGAGLIISNDAGAVATPSYTFTGDLDSGVYAIGANNIGIAVNATKRLDIGTTGLGVVGVLKNGDGAVGAPAYSYTSDTDSGSYIIGANNIGIAVNGAKVLDIATAGLGITGTLTAPAYASATSTNTTLTLTSAYYGQVLFYSPAAGATPTLPANGAAAGSWFDIILLTDQTTVISAASAGTLITDGTTGGDSVAFSTASHKIGSAVRFISNGSVWIAINLGSTTMTVA